MTEPTDSIRTWLTGSGFPLEFKAARAFRARGFEVHQGLHYADEETGKHREIDALAVRNYLSASPRPVRTSILFVVECKAGGPPWAVLHGDEPGGKWEALDALPLEPMRVEHVLSVLDEAADPWVLNVPSKPGYRAVVAHVKVQGDPPFEAFTQVVNAARALVQRRPSLVPTIAVPVVVTEAPLYSVRFSENGEPVVASTPYQRLLWRGHPRGGRYVVDLVAGSGLAEYVERAATASEDLLPLLRDAWLANRYEISDEFEARHYPPRRVSRWRQMVDGLLERMP